MNDTPVAKGAGGTPGGIGTFFLGSAMLVVGAYLLLTRVMVGTSGWSFYCFHDYGHSRLPLLVGVGVLFFNGRSALGWGLTAIGALIIFAGIIANLTIHFQSTSLYDTLVILGLIAGGLGVIARSFRASVSP